MLDIGDKLDNTAGASGELTADEFNDHKNEIQEAVEVTGQALSQVKTPDQLGRAMFINGTSAQSFSDSGTANQIILTPVTGTSGLIVPDAYAQMDGMIVVFDKSIATTSTSVTVNIGQTTGSLLGAKNLNGAVIGMDGTIALRYDLGSNYWEAISLYNERFYTKAEIDQSYSSVGFIQTELVTSGTNLLVKKPKIAVEVTIGTRIIYDSSSDVTIDLTGLTANTWYAVVAREDTGAITAETIASFGTSGGGSRNWDDTNLSNNQLDMYNSLYDFDRKYCRANNGTNWYRVLGVFKTNATPNGISISLNNVLLFPIFNIPKTNFFVYRSTTQGSNGTVQFNVTMYDINSEWNTGGYYYEAKYRQNVSLMTTLRQSSGSSGIKSIYLNINSTRYTYVTSEYASGVVALCGTLKAIVLADSTYQYEVEVSAATPGVEGAIINNYIGVGI